MTTSSESMPLRFAGSRARSGVVLAVLGAAGLAWWSTAERMTGMDAGPGTDLGTLGWFVGVWAVMMAAMMLPSVAPLAALYATPTRGRAALRALSFVAGYLLVWSSAGIVAYAVFSFGKEALGGQLAWHAGGRWLAAGVLGIAAAYELTRLKDSFLNRCRTPQRVTAGAFEAGVRNGGWCLGCSWALMASLFALGVMSLTWMVVVAGLVAVQKLGPWRVAATRVTAAVLLVLAVALVVSPHDVPGLVVPGGGAMHAMKMA